MNAARTIIHDKTTSSGTTEHTQAPQATPSDQESRPQANGNNIRYEILAPTLRPLLIKFYRSHRSPMRPNDGAQSWVARRQDILAALNLNPVEDGYWLSGLLVAPSLRCQGLASRLIEQALRQTQGPVWLFCHPSLVDFYRHQAFGPTTMLPEALAQRLARYQRHKALVALVCEADHPTREAEQ